MRRRRMPMPWDIAVFLTVGLVGLSLSVQTIVDADQQGSVRMPTSDGATQTAPGERFSDHTIDLGCLEQHASLKRFESQAGLLRFRGRLCSLPSSEFASFDALWIKNIANGYEGTVIFDRYSGSFVTDYLVLRSGENEIEIAWRPELAAVTRKITAQVREL